LSGEREEVLTTPSAAPDQKVSAKSDSSLETKKKRKGDYRGAFGKKRNRDFRMGERFCAGMLGGSTSRNLAVHQKNLQQSFRKV